MLVESFGATYYLWKYKSQYSYEFIEVLWQFSSSNEISALNLLVTVQDRIGSHETLASLHCRNLTAELKLWVLASNTTHKYQVKLCLLSCAALIANTSRFVDLDPFPCETFADTLKTIWGCRHDEDPIRNGLKIGSKWRMIQLLWFYLLSFFLFFKFKLFIISIDLLI